MPNRPVIRNPDPARVQTPILPSFVLATTITSRHRPSNGIRAFKSTIRATSCIGACSRGPSIARANSICAATPTVAASGRPALTHADGKFWLIYTDVKRYGRTSGGSTTGASLRDFHNYLVTCETVDGDWSDPVYMNSSGFDPSLFHDDDGRKWFVNMLWDHRPGNNRFAGIVLQEYDHQKRALIGERRNIFKGTSIGFTEAPHLYRRDGWYYLITAEGGTQWGHAVTLARSKQIDGPYELHPDTYILTARDKPDAPLQRAGHADLVETPSGEVYMPYLCGRPLKKPRTLYPRAGNRDRENGVGHRRMVAHSRQVRRAARDGGSTRIASPSLSGDAGAHGF